MDTPDAKAARRAGPVEVIRLGKDEMNLAEFPIALLTDRVPNGKKTIQFQDQIFDEKTGKRITRKLTISAPDENGKPGLPTAVDNDVILGLIQLTKMVNDFSSRDVEFCRLDLIRLLGWPDSGDSYSRLAVSLKRWLSVTLLYENAWRDNRRGTWVTKGFHILDNIELHDTRTVSGQGELFPSKVTWNKLIFESFQSGYLKTINYGLYVSLKHRIAKQMYRFLSKRMYFGPDLTFDLRDFAFAHIGLSDNYSGNAGKIKEKLQPAIEELEKAGFLEPMTKEDRYQKDGKSWKIRLIQKAGATPALPVAEGGAEAEPPPLVAALVQRGVTRATAEALVREYPERIERQLEYFDYQMGKKPEKIADPPGYLVDAIKKDYAAPKGFTSRADRERQAEATRQRQQAEAEARRRDKEQQERERAERKAIAAYWDALTKQQQADHDAAAIAQATAEELKLIEPGPLHRIGMGLLRDGYTRKLLQAQGKLLSAKA